MSRTVTRTLLAGALASVTFSAYPAAAQNRTCAPRADLVKMLSAQFEEKQTAVGIADNGMLLEILTNTDSGSWTVLFSMPNGVSCLVASGESWQSKPFVRVSGPPV